MKIAAIGLVLGLARAQDLGQLPPDVPCYSAWVSAFGEDVLYTLTAFQPYIDCMIATMGDQYIGQPMFIGDSNIHFWRNTQGIMPTALNLGISRASCAQIAKVIGAALDHFQPSDAIVSCGGEYWWGDIWRKMEAYSYDWTNDTIASDAYADAKDLVDTLAGLNGNHAVPGILIYLTTTPYMSVNDAAYQYDNYAPLFVSYDQMVADTDFVPAIMNGAFQQGISYVNVYEAFMSTTAG